MDRILNMVIRQVLNRLVRRGVDAGINQMTRKRADDPDAPAPSADQQARSRDQARNAQRALRAARRVTRL